MRGPADISAHLRTPCKSGKTGRIIAQVLEIAREIIDKAMRIRYLGLAARMYEQGPDVAIQGGGISLTG